MALLDSVTCITAASAGGRMMLGPFPVTVRVDRRAVQSHASVAITFRSSVHRAINSAAYDAALRQRGSLTVWFTDAAIAAEKAEPPHHVRRPIALFGPGYCDGADAEIGVPPGPAAE